MNAAAALCREVGERRRRFAFQGRLVRASGIPQCRRPASSPPAPRPGPLVRPSPRINGQHTRSRNSSGWPGDPWAKPGPRATSCVSGHFEAPGMIPSTQSPPEHRPQASVRRSVTAHVTRPQPLSRQVRRLPWGPEPDIQAPADTEMASRILALFGGSSEWPTKATPCKETTGGPPRRRPSVHRGSRGPAQGPRPVGRRRRRALTLRRPRRTDRTFYQSGSPRRRQRSTRHRVSRCSALRKYLRAAAPSVRGPIHALRSADIRRVTGARRPTERPITVVVFSTFALNQSRIGPDKPASF